MFYLLTCVSCTCEGQCSVWDAASRGFRLERGIREKDTPPEGAAEEDPRYGSEKGSVNQEHLAITQGNPDKIIPNSEKAIIPSPCCCLLRECAVEESVGCEGSSR